MRKFFRRRLLLTLFIVFVGLISSITFITRSRHGEVDDEDDFVASLYDTSFDCTVPSHISPNQSSKVPPHYIVVPYREFVTRTSISCRAFKLDSPRKNTSNLHPKYSRFLRGRFPYIVPQANITFAAIEHFYTRTLAHKKPNDTTVDAPFASNVAFENVPYRFHDGMWYPVGVTSAQRTALIVPLQGREFNAKAFLFNMHAFLRRQQLTYTILLAEQVSPGGSQFNKGRLYNTAVRYLQQKALNITCLILHDVDLLPEHDGNLYACESNYPKHTTSRVRQLASTRGYIRYYEFLIGGVLMMPVNMYRRLNGFSNLYWGWGGEDDDLALRLLQRQMCVVRPSYDLAIYVGLPHPRSRRNGARHGLLSWSTLRINTDGYVQIKSLTRIISVRETQMVTHLKIDAKADMAPKQEVVTTGSMQKQVKNESKV